MLNFNQNKMIAIEDFKFCSIIFILFIFISVFQEPVSRISQNCRSAAKELPRPTGEWILMC